VGKVGAKRCQPVLPDRRYTSPLPARYIRHKYSHPLRRVLKKGLRPNESV
jgi:hypothetical protein